MCACFCCLRSVPIFQSFWILVSVIGGGVFYSEFSNFGVVQWVMFPVVRAWLRFVVAVPHCPRHLWARVRMRAQGIAMTVTGVFFLSQRKSSQEPEEPSRRASNALLLADNRGLVRCVCLCLCLCLCFCFCLGVGGKAHFSLITLLCSYNGAVFLRIHFPLPRRHPQKKLMSPWTSCSLASRCGKRASL